MNRDPEQAAGSPGQNSRGWRSERRRAEARRGGACDVDPSVSRRNDAGGPAPPEPEGRPGVAVHRVVAPPSQWPALLRSSLLALDSQALAARPTRVLPRAARPRTRNREAGYAMLMVFAMAAAIAISLYIELPRVAFEAQREQEQVLVDRGEQYMRAIKLYHRRFKTFPPTMEALENTNNVRFLRRRYPDPMTGKDEWRLIRGMPNGMLVDSLVQKPPKLGQDPTKKDDKDPAASSTGSGGEGEAEHKETRANLRRRPSEQGGDPNYVPMPGQSFDQNQQNQDTQQAGNVPNAFPSGPDQQQASGQPNPGQPGQPNPGQPGQPNPDGTVPPGQPPQPGQPQPGQPDPTGVGSPYPVRPGAPYPVNPGNYGPRPGGPSPAPQPPPNPGNPAAGQGNNEAMQMINKILTSPRPGGLSGIQTSGPNLSGGAIGIAGVATKFEGEGIKVYNERSKYQEWEFVYDLKKDPMMAGQAVGGVSGLPGQGQGQGQTRTTKPGK